MDAYNEAQKEIMATLAKNNNRPIVNIGDVEVMGAPTHEVVRHDDAETVYKGTGQQCSNYLYEHKGIGIVMRRINS